MAYQFHPVTKGPPIDILDNLFGGTPDNFMPNYNMALQRLGAGGGSSPAPLAQLAAARVGADAADHFSQDWLHDWWPQAQPIEPILRQGLLEACQQGHDAQIPMNALWVTGATDQFEIGIAKSAQQLTLLIITPPPPVPPPGEPLEPTGVTIVSRQNGQIVTQGTAT